MSPEDTAAEIGVETAAVADWLSREPSLQVVDVREAYEREAGHIEVGDRVVITAGTQVNLPGSTNVIKVDVA